MLSKLFALAGACADLFNPINHDKAGAALHVQCKLMDADAAVSAPVEFVGIEWNTDNFRRIHYGHPLLPGRQIWSERMDDSLQEQRDAIEAERRRLLKLADELLCRAIALDALNVHLHSAP